MYSPEKNFFDKLEEVEQHWSKRETSKAKPGRKSYSKKAIKEFFKKHGIKISK